MGYFFNSLSNLVLLERDIGGNFHLWRVFMSWFKGFFVRKENPIVHRLFEYVLATARRLEELRRLMRIESDPALIKAYIDLESIDEEFVRLAPISVCLWRNLNIHVTPEYYKKLKKLY